MKDHIPRTRPRALTALIWTEAVFSVVGLMSGIVLVISPSGKLIGLPRDLLEHTPVGDFTLVGLFFLAFYAFLPAVAAYGLSTKKQWRWTDPLNRWTGQHWAWTASIVFGIVPLVWIVVELVLLGLLSGVGGVLQAWAAGWGIMTLLLATRPSVRSSMKLDN